MNFGQALEALKDGRKVARSGWNGKGMHLVYINDFDYYVLIDGEMVASTTGKLLPWIAMKTADNKFVPWLASQTDILAEDWNIVN